MATYKITLHISHTAEVESPLPSDAVERFYQNLNILELLKDDHILEIWEKQYDGISENLVTTMKIVKEAGDVV